MISAIHFLAAGALGILICFLAALTVHFWRKAQVESGVSLSCSSGDSEGMNININFLKNEPVERKKARVAEAFSFMEDRRLENHEKMMKVRAEALAENEKLPAEDLTMGRLTSIKAQAKENT